MDSKEPNIDKEINEFLDSQNSINKKMEDSYDEFTDEYNQSMSELHQIAKKYGFKFPDIENENLLPAEDTESKISLALTELNLFKMSISALQNPELNRLTRDNIVGHILILEDIDEDQKDAFVDMVNDLLQDHIDALEITPNFIESYRERMNTKHNNQLISTGLRTAVDQQLRELIGEHDDISYFVSEILAVSRLGYSEYLHNSNISDEDMISNVSENENFNTTLIRQLQEKLEQIGLEPITLSFLIISIQDTMKLNGYDPTFD